MEYIKRTYTICRQYFTNQLFLVFSISVLIQTIEYCVFSQLIGGLGGKEIISIFKCFSDIILINSLILIFPKYRNFIAIILQISLSLFFFANICNYRFWDEFLSPLSYKLATNVNTTLFNSIFSLFRPIDIVFIISPLIAIAAVIIISKKFHYERFKLKTRLSIVFFNLFIFVLGFSARIYSEHKQASSILEGKYQFSYYQYIKNRLSYKNQTVIANHCRQYGITVYLYKALCQILQDIITNGGKINLTDSEISEINNFIHSIPMMNNESFSENKNKNLIIIIVESLNSYVIDKTINNHLLTPTLTKLVNSAGTISALNVIGQVKDGCSNDGQMIINTGLLPLNNGVVSFQFGTSNIFPGLPLILGTHDNAAIFGDNGQTWNQIDAFKSYGFNKIFTELDFKEEATRIGNDGAMFNYGLSVIRQLRTPFLIELVSFSTHVPFTDEGVTTPEWLSSDKSLEINERNYFAMINYFDSQLGNFINGLQQLGKWDNTILMIMSDHAEGMALKTKDNPNGISTQGTNIPVVFIACNTGISYYKKETVGQINIFPTILQIMGSHGYGNYHGLGSSIMDSNVHSAMDSQGKIFGSQYNHESEFHKRQWSVSDSIHLGNYFGHISNKIITD